MARDIMCDLCPDNAKGIAVGMMTMFADGSSISFCDPCRAAFVFGLMTGWGLTDALDDGDDGGAATASDGVYVIEVDGAAPTGRECGATYERPSGRERGDRIIRCGLNAGHDSPHLELETAVAWVDGQEAFVLTDTPEPVDAPASTTTRKRKAAGKAATDVEP